MAVVLSVDRCRWRRHLAETVVGFDSLVTAVVKGNGYGFGRATLTNVAAELGITSLAVGTVFELAGTERFPGDVLALTPSFDDVTSLAGNAIVTIASDRQLDHLRRQRHTGGVAVKLQSSMLRHGFDADHLPAAAALGGCELHSYVLHLPLSGSADEHLAEVERWLPPIDPSVMISVSHLDSATFGELRRRHPERRFAVRLGTALWLGDKSMIALRAEVLDVRTVRAGVSAGYRSTPIPADGTLVLIGGGSAHGLAPLDDGRSPFHFARYRMALIEPPHMHTSMAFVPAGQPTPEPGEWVDVQRPLTMTYVDRITWTDPHD
jgi:alanine racemase